MTSEWIKLLGALVCMLALLAGAYAVGWDAAKKHYGHGDEA